MNVILNGVLGTESAVIKNTGAALNIGRNANFVDGNYYVGSDDYSHITINHYGTGKMSVDSRAKGFDTVSVNDKSGN